MDLFQYEGTVKPDVVSSISGNLMVVSLFDLFLCVCCSWTV